MTSTFALVKMDIAAMFKGDTAIITKCVVRYCWIDMG